MKKSSKKPCNRLNESDFLRIGDAVLNIFGITKEVKTHLAKRNFYVEDNLLTSVVLEAARSYVAARRKRF